MIAVARPVPRRHINWPAIRSASAFVVASTWLVHGLYNKLLGGSSRHLQIVQSTPGLDGIAGEQALVAIGLGEVALAMWVISGGAPRLCATVQTFALLSCNVVELTFAPHLLLWPAGVIPANLDFLALAWIAAGRGARTSLRTRLRRHPVPIQAHFKDCLTLTYALPADVLRPLLSPELELETFNGYEFVAVALVQTESLRPAGLPRALGQDFFLAGYRVFATCRVPDGRTLRGLRILRSDANRTGMVVGGNLLTHYNYHRCEAAIEALPDRLRISVRTRDAGGDLDVTAVLGDARLPAGSPFESWQQARRFAGPLPFTFDVEQETQAIVAIEATRTNWRPAPITVDVRTLSFFAGPAFRACAPILAAAFHVRDVDYRWERGEVIAW